MAITTTHITTTGATSTTATTSSFTPSANSRLFALGGSRTAAGVAPVITDSLGSTWTLVPSSDIETGNVNASLYYLDIGGSPTSMTVTVTSTGATQVAVGVTEVTGHSTDLTNFVTDTDAAGDTSLTTAAMAASSTGFAFRVQNAGNAPATTPTGYSSVYNVQPATNLRLQLFSDAASPGAQQDWTSTGTDTIAYGLEIKEAGSGTQAITGALVSNTNTFYDATVGRGAVGITGALVTNTQTFFAATLAAIWPITGALFTNTQSFHAATVGRGSVNVAGGLFSNSPQFYTANVGQTGGPAQEILGDLWGNPQEFFIGTVTPGAVAITAARFNNAGQFFTATLAPGTATILGTLYQNTQTFYNAQLSNGDDAIGALFMIRRRRR